ncbi:hypothetical protein NPIL_111131 [Nephila pilipes]|uniref:Uncharacterized protein n=1 Tax=Nephila pilipes TaxID=299642 RepID=A0A8X6NSK0_NEPPI|nr:hypothetical protein NPIL_111131 [Nephila pilipes]
MIAIISRKIAWSSTLCGTIAKTSMVPENTYVLTKTSMFPLCVKYYKKILTMIASENVVCDEIMQVI